MGESLTAYRPQALSVEDFHKLDVLAAQSLSFRNRQIRQVYRDTDEYGDQVERVRYLDGGPEIHAKGEVKKALIESLSRPASSRHIGVHLARLSAHKPYGRGPEGFSIIVEDLCRDLEGVSEYAIMKSCEHFRRDDKITFFPDTAVFLKWCRDLDFSLKGLGCLPQKQDFTPPDVAVEKPPSTKERRRVGRGLKILAKQVAGRIISKWEQRFFDAMTKPKFTPKHQPPAHNFGYGEGA